MLAINLLVSKRKLTRDNTEQVKLGEPQFGEKRQIHSIISFDF